MSSESAPPSGTGMEPKPVKSPARPRKRVDGILVRRSVKAPGAAQYCMHELELSKEIPDDVATEERLRLLLEMWQPRFEAFEAAYAKTRPAPQTSPPPPPQPSIPNLNINRISWQPNKYGSGDYASAAWPECQPLLNYLTTNSKPLVLGLNTYSLNAARTYIYRKPTS